MNEWNEQELQGVQKQLLQKIDGMLLRIGDKTPHAAGADGRYDDTPPDAWTSGFWPGILWLAYGMTGDERYKAAAWDRDRKLEQMILQPNRFHHDVGFQMMLTAVIKHKLTGDEDARRRGLNAAGFLAGRFNLPGRFIRAWEGEGKQGWSIVDTAMNLSLLFWAANESGDPRYSHIAAAHADTIVKHFIRPDGSANHIVSFDPATGERLESLGGQGFAPDSAWSRGAAWALYGMANVYRYTGNPAYLHASQRVAHFFVANLPEDYIPYWDFRADGDLADEPRDSSAGAIAASGLLELASLLPGTQGRCYRSAACRILRSLHERCGTWNTEEHEAILLHGTGHKPAGQNVDVSLIYGDYYFAEALDKLGGWRHRVF